MLSLPELQSAFFHALARISGDEVDKGYDSALVQCVQGRGHLGPEQRLDIYAQMYYWRLLDVLQEDFPCVAAILGRDHFYALARAYLRRYPSTNPSLRYVGRHFPAFLETEPGRVDGPPFLSDLARLEWARVDVFDAPDAEPLRLETLQKLPPEDWPALRLRMIPACHILDSTWPVHHIWCATTEAHALPDMAQPQPTTVRLWRKGFTICQSSMDDTERTAFACVVAEKPFAELCAVLEPLFPPDKAARVVGSLLLRWIEDEVLSQAPS